MKRRGTLLALVLALSLVGCSPAGQRSITVFAGSVLQPAMTELGRNFEERTGIKVYFSFGGSGTMLAQMKLAQSGDIYMPASPDYVTLARQEGVIRNDVERRIAYLVPAILVPRGNPKNIRTLADLARPGIRLGVANPQAVSVGAYAMEILDYNKLLETVSPNIVTYAESYAKAVSLLALKSLDATIGWDVFARWQPDSFEVVYLRPEQVPRIAYAAGAVATFTKDKASADRFLDFVVSPSGQDILRKWGFITEESEARKLAPNAVIGGEPDWN
ncbi:MAG: molybdate ABC transporter substrate-binding protein [Chloroflexi bacterium]|nr:molybdate ABC transporter substrate-binding protein [Chloroflexota bacterium]